MIWWIVGGICAGLLLFTFALCKVAGVADDRMDEIMRRGEKE